MNDKRDEVVEAAREFLTLHEPGDDALAMMADFALSREAELHNEITQLKADLATAKQGLEHIAGNWECGHQGECSCLSDIAQQTLDAIGKE